MLTSGIDAFPHSLKAQVMRTFQQFGAFNGDNDPFYEHDCFTFSLNGETIICKCDYYAPDMQHGAEDPTEPEVCMRVWTIMKSDEY
jgi:hypothetical protein